MKYSNINFNRKVDRYGLTVNQSHLTFISVLIKAGFHSEGQTNITANIFLQLVLRVPSPFKKPRTPRLSIVQLK